MAKEKVDIKTEDILTLKEIAKYLRYSERTLWTFIKKKKIPYFRIGCEYRFKMSEINSWIKSKGGN